MCGNPFRRPRMPEAPPPLPPPPPQPPVPAPPKPLAQSLAANVNPQVRKTKSKKTKSQLAKGSGELRIPLDPRIAGGVAAPTGGINNPETV